MKYRTYFITYMAFAVTHMMYTSTPFVYFRIKEFLALSMLQISMFSTLFFAGLGLSLVWFAFNPIKNLLTTYLIWITTSNIFFILFSVLISFDCHILLLYYVSSFGFGISQGPVWPILLSLVHVYFSAKEDGCLIGA